MNEWKTVRLGDYITEYSVKNKNCEDIPVYSVTNTQGFCTEYFSKDVSSKDKSNYKIVPRGYFAYNPSRINVGSVDWQRYEDRVIVSPLYNVFGVSNELDNQYLYYFIKSDFGNHLIKSKAEGSVRDNLKLSMLSEFPIPMPPLAEQKHIAAILDKTQKIIAEHKQMLQKYDTLIKSRFIEMFGDPHNNTKYTYKNVGDFTTVTSGGTPDRKNIEYWKNGNIPWVKTTELQNNELTNVEEFITQKGLDESSAKMMPIGTLLIAMYGQGKTRGMTAYLGIEASTNQACACILPSKVINQKFLWYYFILSYDKLRDLAKGGNQPNLNGNMIKDFPVLMPPIEMQNEYVSFVQQIDKSKFAVQKSLEKTETLYKSLMQQYFG